jgi:hypothetical protein
MQSPNPSIVGEAVRNALTSDESRAADAADASTSRAALDEEELRELERTEFYADAPAPAAPAPRRTWLDRLLRR